MNIKLSDFVSSGHTITDRNDVAYPIPVAGSEVMLEFVWLETQMSKRPLELIDTVKKAQEEGWDGDEAKIMAAIRENAEKIDEAGARFREIALGLLKSATPDLPPSFDKITIPDAVRVIRLALGQEEEVSAQEMAAAAIGYEKQDLEAEASVADPPTSRQKAETATMRPPRSRSATRSRKRS